MATHTNEDSVFESFIIPCNVSFVDNQRDIIRSVILKNALLNLNNGNILINTFSYYICLYYVLLGLIVPLCKCGIYTVIVFSY